MTSMPGRRGRPPKYGSPSKIVAVTLPEDVVEQLKGIHDDLGWAIVRVVEQWQSKRASAQAAARKGRPAAEPGEVVEAELASVAPGQALIVVNSAAVRSLPGVQLIPISDGQAFLALEPGKAMADLELAVLDRLESLPPGSRDRAAVDGLLRKLQRWRRDERLAFHSRAIILVSGV
jgi:hypothetical protein